MWTGDNNGDTFTKGKQKPVVAPNVLTTAGGGDEKKKSGGGKTVQQKINAPAPAPVQQNINPSNGFIRPETGWGANNWPMGLYADRLYSGASVPIPTQSVQPPAPVAAPLTAPSGIGTVNDQLQRPQAETYGFTAQSNMLPDTQRSLQAHAIAATKYPTEKVYSTDPTIKLDPNSMALVGTKYDPNFGEVQTPITADNITKQRANIVEAIMMYQYNTIFKKADATTTYPQFKILRNISGKTPEDLAQGWVTEQIIRLGTGGTVGNTGGTAGTVPGATTNAGAGNTGGTAPPPAAGTPLKGSGPFTLEQINGAYPNAAEGKMGGTFADLTNKSMTWQDSYGNLSPQYYSAALPKKSGFYIWNGNYYKINQAAIKAYKSGGGGSGWGGYWNNNSGSKWYEQMTNWTIL